MVGGVQYDKIKSHTSQVTDPQTGKQKYQSSVVKVLSPMSGFPVWGSDKETGIWQRNWRSTGNLAFKISRIWLHDFHRTGGNRDTSLGGHKINLRSTKTQRKGAVTPQEGRTKTTCWCWRASWGGVGWQGSTRGQGPWQQQPARPPRYKPSWRSPLTLP